MVDENATSEDQQGEQQLAEQTPQSDNSQQLQALQQALQQVRQELRGMSQEVKKVTSYLPLLDKVNRAQFANGGQVNWPILDPGITTATGGTPTDSTLVQVPSTGSLNGFPADCVLAGFSAPVILTFP